MPKLLFFITEDWYFCSHRLPLAVAAVKAGYEVAILTHVSAHREIIEAAGIRVFPLDLQRRSLNPLQELKTLLAIIRVYRAEKPDIVHHVAMKPVLYGSIAALCTGTSRVVNALAGLGFLFSSSRLKARLIRPIVSFCLKFLLGRDSHRLILQNPDDQRLFSAAGLVKPDQIRLIRGSGVDTDTFVPSPVPSLPPTVVLASRLLWDKGIAEFVAAVTLIKQAGISARFVLVGESDHENPAAIPQQQITAWQQAAGIEWWGRRTDMPQVFAQAHIVCLPSYREGLPKVLLEAAACGRPIVTTDVPGCREVVKHGVNGLLVPPKDPAALADALLKLLENPELRRQMGAKGREMVVQEFAQEIVIEQTLAVYKEMMKP